MKTEKNPIDPNALKQLSALDDEALRMLVNNVAQVCGLDEKIASKAGQNTEKIRKALSNATENDIQKAVGRLGEDKVAELLEQIKKL